jgi:environmental stress-induced protein Ves
MTVRCIPAARIVPVPWRNGGGRTRELLAWPSAAGWRLRISLADIDRDGAFSAFPGVQRWFTVVEGAGVALSFDGASASGVALDGEGAIERRLVLGDAPLGFDGAAAPACRLLDGPTRDLNLMLRGGRGTMQAVVAEREWAEGHAMRGLFVRVAGRWTGDDASARLAPRPLLGSVDAARPATPWRFDTDTPGEAPAGWWLGYTPDEAAP